MCASFSVYGIYSFNIASQFIQGRATEMDEAYLRSARKAFRNMGFYFLFDHTNQTSTFCNQGIQLLEWNSTRF
jgi:hypothetical protein